MVPALRPYVTPGEAGAAAAYCVAAGVGVGITSGIAQSWWVTALAVLVGWACGVPVGFWLFGRADLRRNR